VDKRQIKKRFFFTASSGKKIDGKKRKMTGKESTPFWTGAWPWGQPAEIIHNERKLVSKKRGTTGGGGGELRGEREKKK